MRTARPGRYPGVPRRHSTRCVGPTRLTRRRAGVEPLDVPEGRRRVGVGRETVRCAVRACSAVQLVLRAIEGRGAAVEAVVAVVAPDRVRATATLHQVLPDSASERVVARVSVDSVVARLPEDLVVASVAA